MSDRNYTLFVASYADAGLAAEDFKAIKAVNEDNENWYAVGAYVFTILISLIDPTVAIALYFAIAVFLFVPFQAVARAVTGKRPS
jgi:hypothetical protein